MAVSLLELYLAPPSSDSDAPGGWDRGFHPNAWNARPNEAVGVPPEDASLVARIRAGDKDAFAHVARQYSERLFRFAYRELWSREAAEEVVQDVLTSVWARRSAWVVTGTIATYLFQSVRHRVLNVRRARRSAERLRERLSEPDAPFAPVSMTTPTAAIEEAELRAALGCALARLPERPRQVFQLSREQHLTFREIAEVLGLSMRTVEHHMARAISVLRKELADWVT